MSSNFAPEECATSDSPKKYCFEIDSGSQESDVRLTASQHYTNEAQISHLPLRTALEDISNKYQLQYVEVPVESLEIDPQKKCPASDEYETTEQATQTPISAEFLPERILIKIFSYLSTKSLAKCAQVCSRWIKIIYNEPKFWESFDLSELNLDSLCLLSVLKNRSKNLYMSFTRVKSLPDDNLRNFGLTALKKFDVSYSSFPKELLGNILENSPQLTHLSLEGHSLKELNFEIIATKIKNLEVLNIAMTRGLNSKALCKLVNNCLNLTDLNICWSTFIRNGPELKSFASNCSSQSLKRLNMSGGREHLNDEILINILKNFPNLTYLDISDSTEITGRSIDAILSNLSDLNFLAISRCYKITSRSYLLQVFGMFRTQTLAVLQNLLPNVDINKIPFSCVARSNYTENQSYRSRKFYWFWGVNLPNRKFL